MITTHIIKGAPGEPLSVERADEMAFGAYHEYRVGPQTIAFQKGPIKDHGVNGITEDALLAVLIDRLQCFVEAYGGVENENTLAHLEAALESNQRRTRRRIAEGTEGTSSMKPGDR